MNPYYSGRPSDHFDGVRFFNPGHPQTDRDLRDLLRWKLKGMPAVWPRSVAPRQVVPEARVDRLRSTIVGHASVLIQAGGLNVLTSGRPGSMCGKASKAIPGAQTRRGPKNGSGLTLSDQTDLALIPIGAYAPRWFMSPQHTDPNEAVQILEDLEAARAVGIHWGVFRLTDERRDEPTELLLEALARRGIASSLFPAGEPGLSYESA